MLLNCDSGLIYGRTFMKTRLQKCMFGQITVGNNLELSYKVVFLLAWDYKYQITIGNNLELAYKVVFLLD